MNEINNIPKKIHYCWFGGKPLNKLGQKCLKSWKKYFPDYEIIEWNESNFDFNCCQYVKEAYEAKKWAFVSDYARYKILYEEGGLYFDTDVEVIKSFNDILQNGSFMGCENPNLEKKMEVNPGLGAAAVPGLAFYREILDDYEKSTFYNADGSLNLYTIVERTTDFLYKHGLKHTLDIQTVADITIYPSEYFAPINTKTTLFEKTKNTHSIHRYAASWVGTKSRINRRIYWVLAHIFGIKFADWVKKMSNKRKR